MPPSYLIFDFARDEDAALLARHKLENWKQAFRLGNKLDLRFERTLTAENDASPAKSAATTPAPPTPAKGKSKSANSAAKKSAANEPASPPNADPAPPDDIRLIVRLEFSDHEKLTHQRWLDRIPSEDPFKSASPKTVRSFDPAFADTHSLYESLSLAPAHRRDQR